MSKKRAYMHLDVETMSLKAHKGLVWQLGVSVTTGELATISDWEFTSHAYPGHWDDDTLQWAIKTYGTDWLERISLLGNVTLLEQSLVIAVGLRDLVDSLKSQDYEVWIVANHPEFDVTHLRVIFDRLEWEFPVKYNHILDLGSLLVGDSSCRSYCSDEPNEVVQTPSEILSKLGKKKSAVAHTALADAMDQVDTLRRRHIYLPA